MVAFEVSGAGGAGETEALYSSGNSLMLAASDACLDRAGDDDAGAVVVEHCIFEKANCMSEMRARGSLLLENAAEIKHCGENQLHFRT